ncbi:MAG: SAM-dependent methyltransferase [Eubacteriales bacterium]|nr:SAM-dependent methyltransferase [Eubacteriales bacterium]
MIKLPEEFLNRMKNVPGLDFEAFLASYDEPSVKGLRFNKKKVRPETVEMLVSEWNLEKIPWSEYGYIYDESLRPGLSPYHDAGVFYIQDPGAMYPGEVAPIEATDVVLDLCAAPGGKTTRLCEKAGVVLSNEIIPNRARVLSSNIERMGFSNDVVSQASPAELSAVFPEFFDCVVVDAPCSGEGMMRKDETAVEEWSVENVELCIRRQKEILKEAVKMLKPGGTLVYSTCTFEPGENEEHAQWLIDTYGDFTLVSEKTFYPHLERGEGQYCAVLKRDGEKQPGSVSVRDIERRLSRSGIHILRAGVTEGETLMDKKKGKIYVPSHAEVMATVFYDNPFVNALNIRDLDTALEYLKGNVLRTVDDAEYKNDKDGFIGVYFDGYPLGLGKKSGNVIKNHYPKGLRRMN